MHVSSGIRNDCQSPMVANKPAAVSEGLEKAQSVTIFGKGTPE
jgi:hypothetical protein